MIIIHVNVKGCVDQILSKTVIAEGRMRRGSLAMPLRS